MIEIDWLKRWAQYSPNKTAVKDGETGRKFSYADFYRLSQVGCELLKTQYNIQTGDRVAVFAPNEIEYVFLFFALQRAGAIMVPINYRLTEREIEHILRDSEPTLLISHNSLDSVVAKINPSLLPQSTLSLGDFADFIYRNRTQTVHEMAASFESPCMILYTSGTTGAPKGAIITYKMIFWNSINTSLRLNLSENDVTVTFLPFFHTGGWNVLTTPFLHKGATVIFLKKFEADQILQLCEDERATILFGVPTTMDMMARCETYKKVSLQSIRYAIVGGEPMPLELIKTWDHKGISVRQGYGLTEFGPNVFSLNEEDSVRKIGSIGFPNFYIETKVVDDEGSEVSTGEIGELILKGPMCMAGYWRNEKATQETIRNGWLHTGDLVRKDDEGFFYVVGRKKDMFISGGENVYPAEIEQILQAIPGVREAAVIGVSDMKWGEVGKAFIVKENPDLGVESILSHCQKNLAKFKIPKHVSFIDSLPKGTSGKILKRELKELN